MWVISDEGMRVILGGEFVEVYKRYSKNKTISINKLYNHQSKYKTYAGFRKFYKKITSILAKDVKIIHLPHWLDFLMRK